MIQFTQREGAKSGLVGRSRQVRKSLYRMPADCLEIDDVWGTPEILKDFGFVENHPHRWIFENNGSTI